MIHYSPLTIRLKLVKQTSVKKYVCQKLIRLSTRKQGKTPNNVFKNFIFFRVGLLYRIIYRVFHLYF